LVLRMTHHLPIERWRAAAEAVPAYFSGAKELHVLFDSGVGESSRIREAD